MDLIIFEKEIQAKTVCSHFKHLDKGRHVEISPDATYFPNGAIGVWCSGHILRLQEPHEYQDAWKRWELNQLPMIPEQFKYARVKTKNKHFQSIKQWLNDPKIKRVIHAGDAGREGQIIVDEVLRFAKNPHPVVRLWSKSLSKQPIQKAVKQMKPNEHYRSLSEAAEARAESDWLIGLNSTRLLSLLLQNRGVNTTFTAGRVQTPLLSLITKRHDEIKRFKKEPFWQLNIHCQPNNSDVSSTYPATLNKGKDSQIFDYEEAKEVQAFLDGASGVIKSVDVHTEYKPAPQLYNLTDLSNDANDLYNYSLEKTLSIAQSLYEKAIISYPRANPRVVSKDEAKDFPGILNLIHVNLPEYRSYFPIDNEQVESVMNNKRYVNDEETDDHHAIIPTEQVTAMQNLTEDEQRIYDLVLRRFIGIHLPPKEEKKLEIETLVEQQFRFYSSYKEVMDLGWSEIRIKTKKEKNDGHSNQIEDLINYLSEGEPINVESTDLKEGETKPSSYFTEGQLGTVMENAYYYLSSEERKGFSKEHLSLGTVATRPDQIENLKRRNYIEVKKKKVYPTLKGRLLIYALRDTWLSSVLTTGKLEQELDLIHQGKKHKAELQQKATDLVQQLIKDTTKDAPNWTINEQVQADLSDQKKKNASNSKKQSRKTPKPIGTCLSCGGTINDLGTFYGCSNYKEKNCKFRISKTILGQEISLDHIMSLLENGETKVIRGFKGKEETDEPFNAKLSWDDKRHKIKFNKPKVFKWPLNLLEPLNVTQVKKEHQESDFKFIEKEAKSINKPVKVVDVKYGPRIIRYDLLPDPGINLSTYNRYKANFQAALRADQLSMYIPIAGTNLVGIEVPNNKNPYPVQLRGLLESNEFEKNKKRLTFPLGMDIHGKPYYADLESMPHLLIAGATGSGKSVFLNALIASLMFTNRPEDLKFLFIDPKQVELNVYEDSPYLFSPIITDTKRAALALKHMIKEMERRYELLREEGVRNVASYNAKMEREGGEKLPIICVVIDEIADLIMTTEGEVEDYIVRLSQLARASSIHLIVATQRPTKKVLSPIIKANMPVRVSFSVASSADSMTILDQTGAENLLGQGDMIYLSKERPPQRLQSGFLSDEDTQKVLNYINKHYEPKEIVNQ